jgi:hypothetical protein
MSHLVSLSRLPSSSRRSTNEVNDGEQHGNDRSAAGDRQARAAAAAARLALVGVSERGQGDATSGLDRAAFEVLDCTASRSRSSATPTRPRSWCRRRSCARATSAPAFAARAARRPGSIASPTTCRPPGAPGGSRHRPRGGRGTVGARTATRSARPPWSSARKTREAYSRQVPPPLARAQTPPPVAAGVHDRHPRPPSGHPWKSRLCRGK